MSLLIKLKMTKSKSELGKDIFKVFCCFSSLHKTKKKSKRRKNTTYKANLILNSDFLPSKINLQNQNHRNAYST